MRTVVKIAGLRVFQYPTTVVKIVISKQASAAWKKASVGDKDWKSWTSGPKRERLDLLRGCVAVYRFDYRGKSVGDDDCIRNRIIITIADCIT